MAGASIPKLPPPSTGKTLTILSIDGGGIRGLIPAVALQYLEDRLKELDGEGARIADYFDVIGGVSTGGLIAAMLTVTDGDANNPRPKFTADDVRDFYVVDGPLIFPEVKFPPLVGPKHHGNHLRSKLDEHLGSTLLEDTWTNVVIPAFDIYRIAPAIFSSYKLNGEYKDKLNARMYDICLATSAAPTYLKVHQFTVGAGESETEYHTTDGGVAAGNPTLVALSELRQDKDERPELYPMMKNGDDYTNVLVVSLGCGVQSPSERPGFTADQANGWTSTGWLINLPLGRSPLLEFYYDGAMETMDYYVYSLFKGQNAEHNYLRVQADTLTKEMAVMDDASDCNLKNLECCAKKMLKEPVKRINPVTFELEPIGDGTYAKALTEVAKALSKERKIRLGTYIGIPE